MNAAPTSPSWAVRFDHVSFAYPAKGPLNKPHIALRDISFDIHQGEYVCLLGSNGSGKSTAAQLINGLLLPTKGDVITCGFNTRDEDHIFDIRSQAAMVFQNPQDQIIADICTDDVAFGPENLCLDHNTIVQRTDNALCQVELSAFANANPAKLSGGQQQRVTLAGSIAMAPKVLILDEPTAMLDTHHKNSIITLIHKLHSLGFTIIHITHDMDDVMNAQRVLAFNQSRLVLDTTPQELFEDPACVERLGLRLPPRMQLQQLLKQPQHAIAHTTRATPEHTTPVLEFKHVSFSYVAPAHTSKLARFLSRGQHTDKRTYPWAIHDASFAIEPGSFTALIGQSGSGKSTTLSLSCGLINPTRGEILLNGTSLSQAQHTDNLFHTIGYVAQSAEHQLFAQTVYDDIAFGPRNQGRAEKDVDACVTQAAARVGIDLSRLAHTSPFSLSGGQQKLVALAGVLAMEPSMLILDEPLAGLDPAGRQHILELLKDLNAQGTTILLVTHSIDDAAAFSSHILAFKKGAILAHCPTREFFSTPVYLEQLDLECPSSMRLAQNMRDEGHTIEQNPLTLQELAFTLANTTASLEV